MSLGKLSNSECPICNGNGKLENSFFESIPCEYCDGTGKMELSKQREYLDLL
jgi:hypothetical protein